MTYSRDPNRLDDPMPLGQDPIVPSRRGGSAWGWIAGGILAVLVLAFLFGFGRDDTRTADTGMSRPATTGQMSSPPPALAPPSTTGQATR
jgi:hypothetical protein